MRRVCIPYIKFIICLKCLTYLNFPVTYLCVATRESVIFNKANGCHCQVMSAAVFARKLVNYPTGGSTKQYLIIMSWAVKELHYTVHAHIMLQSLINKFSK